MIGFDSDAPPRALLSARAAGAETTLPLTITPGDFDVQRIGGLPSNQVAPTDPVLLERIKREGALKTAAFASRWDADRFAGGFTAPVQARVSGRFGGQRVLNGVPARPHYGVDLACPRGTPVLAPAGGMVVLAEPAMHYEGGLILIDHGQGLVSAYLHLSRLDVARGAVVGQGQRIGAVGATGRATGPHLCWRLKWRERNMDPMLLTA
jgi:murein DD-endopeptidase MepM/ murein hydrolase activator NlpD